MAGPTGVRAGPATSSVAFLVGTAAWPDGFLSQGRLWVKAVQTKAGGAPGVQMGDLGASVAAVTAAVQRFSRNGAKAQVPAGVLDKNLGGLRGHTLVFVTHGLDSHGGGLTKAEREAAQGLLFFNAVKGESPRDKVLFKMHLDFMTLEQIPGGSGEDKRVIADPKLASVVDDADGKKIKKEVAELVPLIDALRQSIFQRTYLAACGGGRRLHEFAARLKQLTGLSVYWNDDTISFPTPPVAPFAEVGPIVNGVTKPLRDGLRFFKPDAPANKVPLRSTTDGFLEGSMERLP